MGLLGKKTIDYSYLGGHEIEGTLIDGELFVKARDVDRMLELLIVPIPRTAAGRSVINYLLEIRNMLRDLENQARD